MEHVWQNSPYQHCKKVLWELQESLLIPPSNQKKLLSTFQCFSHHQIWLLPWWWRLKHRQTFFNIRLYQRPFLSIYAGVNCEAAALSVLVFPGVLANMVGRWSCTECSMLSFVRFHHECWGSTIPTWCRRKGVFRKWMWWNIFTVFVSP